MRKQHTAFALLLAALSATACARGCNTPPPAAVVGPDVVQSAAGTPRDVEAALKIQLIERKAGRDLLAGWHMLPWRRLRTWQPAEHQIVRLGLQGLSAGASSLGVVQAAEPASLTEFFAALHRAPAQGTVPRDELVLAIDAQTPPDLVSAVRAVILDVAPWRVVILARDGEQLVEVQLNPPRPAARLPQAPTASAIP